MRADEVKNPDRFSIDMQPTRRQFIAATGAFAAAGLAGCTGELTGEGAAFGAAEARLSASVRSETGYTHHRTVEDVQSRHFERYGISRSVDVTSVISEYDRAIELGVLGTRVRAAVFASLSTPQIRVFGRNFNPVETMSSVDIAELIQERYDNIDDVREDHRFEARVGEATTTVTRFRATARLVELGAGIDIYLYISSAVELDDDFVVTMAAHPQAFGEQVETVRALMGGVEHQS